MRSADFLLLVQRYGPPLAVAIAVLVAIRRSTAFPPLLPDLHGAPSWVLVAFAIVTGLLAGRGIHRIGKIDGQLVAGGYARSPELEWIWSADRAKAIVDRWNEPAKNGAIMQLVRDGVRADTQSFVPYYPLCLFAVTLLVTRWFPPDPRLYAWGVLIAWLALVAGVLDLGENCGILHELNGGTSTRLAPLTAFAAFMKWTLIDLNIAFCIGAFRR